MAEETEKRTMRVPDHYPYFRCKCGECRTPCCSGWGISMSMTDYFRILGLECSRELRERLDTAVSVLTDSTEERYASLDPDWTGHCKLQRKDNGYCMLQCECGEEVLPEVCRRFPRVYRCGAESEAALSSSCERTVELLMTDDEPLKLMTIPVPENFAAIEKKNRQQYEGDEDPALSEEYRVLREKSMEILSDRTMSLCERVVQVIASVHADAAGDDRCTEMSGTLESDEAPHMEMGREENRGVSSEQAGLYLLHILAEDSPSLSEETAAIFEKLKVQFREDDGVETESPDRERADREGEIVPEITYDGSAYACLKEAFDEKTEKQEILFEKLLANHLYFSGFPYSARGENREAEGIALAAVYVLMKFMNICLTDGASEEAVVDLNASIFRLVEHSSFTWNAPIVLKKCGIRTAEDAIRLLRGSQNRT